MLKQMISLLLCVAMVFSMLPVQTIATDDVGEGIIEQTLETESVEETAEPMEAMEEPTEETAEVTEAETESTVKTVEPAQESTTPTEETVEEELEVIPVESVTISQAEGITELAVGDTLKLTATVLPENATDKTVVWSSSDETVATVDANGDIASICTGNVTFYAKCGEISASYAVHIKEKEETNIDLNEEDIIPDEKISSAPELYYYPVQDEAGSTRFVLYPTQSFSTFAALEHEVEATASLPKLPAPTNLRWGISYDLTWNPETQKYSETISNISGSIAWKAPSPTQIRYDISIYRDGKLWDTAGWDFGGIDFLTSNRSVDSFLISNPESGTYYFTVTAMGDEETYSNSNTVKSSTFRYTKPARKVGTVQNPKWQWPYATWSAPSNTSNVGGYYVEYYYGETKNETPLQVGSVWWYGGAEDCRDEIYEYPLRYGAGYYYFKVHALSDDITKACNGNYTKLSAAYYWDGGDVVPEEPKEPDPNDYPAFSYSENTPSQELAEKLSLYSMLAYGETKRNINSWIKGDDNNALGYQLVQDGYEDLRSYYYSTEDIGNEYLSRCLTSSAGENTSPFVLGHRKVNYNNKIVDQIVVVVRGTYDREWYGNFDVTGTSYDSSVDTHWSFEKAADSLNYYLEWYISEMKKDEKIVNQDLQIVLTGHSRGAAVANLLATWLTDIRDGKKTTGIDIGSVYAYTFATPNVAESDKILKTNYTNIHNFCFTDDFVPNLPLESWGWGKYGNTYWATASDLKSNTYFFNCVKNLHDKNVEYSESYTENIVKTMISATEQGGIRQNGVSNYYVKERFIGLDSKITMYSFIRQVLGGAMRKNAAASIYLGIINAVADTAIVVDGHFRALADNLVDKYQAQPALLSTHQYYSYYEAMRTCFGSFKLGRLTEDGYDATPYDLVRPYSDFSNCDPNQIAAIKGFLMQSFIDKDSGTATYNYELLGWDINDISTWLGITWYDGNVIAIDMKYGSVVGELDLSYFPEIERANFEYCNLSSMKASGCSKLAELYCDGNRLTELDLTGLENLINLNCAYNKLTELDVSDCTGLEQLICNGNEILELELSNCTQLYTLICQDNYLDPNDPELKAITEEIIAAGGTAEYSYQNVPPEASFEENDLSCLVNIANFANNNDILAWDLESPESWSQVSWILIAGKYYLEGVDFTGLGLTGDAAFDNCIHLEYLLLDSNKFTGISVDGCTALDTLWCERNYLRSEVLEDICAGMNLSNARFSLQLSEMVLNEDDIAALNQLSEEHNLGWDENVYVVNDALVWYQVGEKYDLVEMDLSSENISDVLDLTSFKNLKALTGMGGSVTEIILPDSVTSLYNSSFANCKMLQTIVFTGGAPEFDFNVFNNLAVEVVYPAGNPTWTDLVKQNCGENIAWIAHGDFHNYMGDAFIWELHEKDMILTVSGNGSLRIFENPWAEYSHQIKSVVIEEGITYLGDSLFYRYDSLESLSLPASLTGLAENAIDGNWNLKEIIVAPGSNCYFSSDGVLFNKEQTNLILYPAGKEDASYTIPDTVTTLEYNSMSYSDFATLSVPESVTYVGDYAFVGCENLKAIAFLNNLNYIGTNAFNLCTNLDEISVAEDNLYYTSEDGVLFSGDRKNLICCPAKKSGNYTIPDGVEQIAGYAFNYCANLTAVTIPDSVTKIGESAFANCSALAQMYLPGGIASVGDYVFAGNSNLKAVLFRGSAPVMGIDVFMDVTTTVYYPAYCDSWKNAIAQDYGGTITWLPIQNQIVMDLTDFAGQSTAWIDGKEYSVYSNDGIGCVDLLDSNAKTMVIYTYHDDESGNNYTQYPVSMKVWSLENVNGFYTATHQTAFDDILQYAGSSIRVTGKKGIRMITSINQADKTALTGDGLAGYTLKEYGTVIAWASQISDSKPLVLGKSWVKSNYAYKQGVADPIFAYKDGKMQYTNVLVNFSDAQCKNDIAMRSYMILADADGNEITLYGGIVERSIGYIALQNKDTFTKGTEEYNYIWRIIRAVYGDAYDE